MRKVIVAVLLSTQAFSQDTELTGRILGFEKHWHLFLKQYFGCDMSQENIHESVCRPATGSTNYKEFRLSREAAKKLFDLAEPK
jgi:hypothetical protein